MTPFSCPSEVNLGFCVIKKTKARAVIWRTFEDIKLSVWNIFLSRRFSFAMLLFYIDLFFCLFSQLLSVYQWLITLIFFLFCPDLNPKITYVLHSWIYFNHNCALFDVAVELLWVVFFIQECIFEKSGYFSKRQMQRPLTCNFCFNLSITSEIRWFEFNPYYFYVFLFVSFTHLLSLMYF